MSRGHTLSARLKRCWVGVALAFLPALAAGAAEAGEPASWTDPKLPVKRGLAVWVDASRQNDARAANRAPRLGSGDAVGVCYDGSEFARVLLQRDGRSQPRFVTSGDPAALRFDGIDDSLEISGLGLSAREATVFVVARPDRNPGGFRGLVSMNALAQNDYTSGLTIDLGPLPSGRLEAINVEGAGFTGARDLAAVSLPFGVHHVFESLVRVGKEGVLLAIDGRNEGSRDRAESNLSLDELTIGARFLSNEPRPTYLQCHFPGDIAEVLVYSRALDDAERTAVGQYLIRKYQDFDAAISTPIPALSEAMRPVVKPPEVQPLAPGFTVRRLPVQLKNVNNLKYRSDGKLVAALYRGDIVLVSDSDGDGLEDKVETFLESNGAISSPIGMALTPPGYPAGDGVFLASKGKVSLVLDRDRDGKADEELVIARGWREIKPTVDALGVAVAPDGSVYFGLGAADYTNAYLLNAEGKSEYDLKGDRGTIQRLSPDFKTRETIATGIRFSVALAFNRFGDLFATDQEGATWLANGNPFDELLYIQKGRHYGFPPRHAGRLPNVIDEPSVFDYRPQHQSTCGLVFNEPTQSGRQFGPAWWAGDAFVCGYSRGKIYRTKLVKTDSGYVAKTDIFARLDKLTVDACISPAGDMVVATHSGGPDWGSGPEGAGTLYKIQYVDRTHPKPTLAWFESPGEARVAFDKTIQADELAGLARRTYLVGGRYVSAGDRFESFRPGYEVVREQQAAPVYEAQVLGASLLADLRTIAIAITPVYEPFSYNLRLPRPERPDPARDLKQGEIAQDPSIDIGLDAYGVTAEWSSADGEESWTGVLPHPDLEVSKSLTIASARHDRLWSRIDRPGKLRLVTSLRLMNMLRPAVQPGAKAETGLAPERVTVEFKGAGAAAAAAAAGGEAIELKSPLAKASGPGAVRLEVTPEPEKFEPIEIVLTHSGATRNSLSVRYHTADDPTPRVPSLDRFVLPWVRRDASALSPSPARVLPRELIGGNWLKGRELFFGDQAKCSRCHSVRGRGGVIGPNLSNLPFRDYESVARDISQPNYAINPDYLSYAISLTSGRVLSGNVRRAGGKLLVANSEGSEIEVREAEIEEMKPLSRSIMPEGIDKVIGHENMKHLLTYLVTDGLEPATFEREGAPPPRNRRAVDEVIRAGGGARAPVSERPLRILLASGAKDHGVDEHDYPRFQERWSRLLALAPGVRTSSTSHWPSRSEWAEADVVVMNSANAEWSAAKAGDLDAFLDRGGGLVLIHWSVNGGPDPDAFAARVGLASVPNETKYRHGPIELVFPEQSKSPIAAGFRSLSLVDETYWKMRGDLSRVNVIAEAKEEGASWPMIWTHEQGKGRVFASIAGHYIWTFDDPLYRVLLLRGICWSAGEPTDRLSELATVGARLNPSLGGPSPAR